MPKLFGDSSRAGGHPGAVHEAEGGLHSYDHHGTRRVRVELGHERLINPSPSEGHAIGNLSNGVVHLWRPFQNHNRRLVLALYPCKGDVLFKENSEPQGYADSRIMFAYCTVSPVRIKPMAKGTRSLNCVCGSKVTGISPKHCSKLWSVCTLLTRRNSSAITILPITKLA